MFNFQRHANYGSMDDECMHSGRFKIEADGASKRIKV